MILVHQKFLRYLLLFMLIILINVYLRIYIDSELLKINCFPYETAFENFRDEEIEEDVLNGFLYAAENHPREEKGQTDIDNNPVRKPFMMLILPSLVNTLPCTLHSTTPARIQSC